MKSQFSVLLTYMFYYSEVKCFMPCEQNITYTPFRTVNTLEENGIELTYTYGPDQSRYKAIWKNNGTGLT